MFVQRFVNLGRTFDVEPLSHLCNMLDAFKEGLDIVALHIKLSDLLFHALAFLEDYDCETVGKGSASLPGTSTVA